MPRRPAPTAAPAVRRPTRTRTTDGPPPDIEPAEPVDAFIQLSRDLRKAAELMTEGEARFLVDSYYQMQKNRIRAGNQAAAMGKTGEPHGVLVWLQKTNDRIETTLRAVLGKYAQSQVAGRWAMSVYGIGPVIAAGLLAQIDITKAPAPSAVMRYAGLDPSIQWKSYKDMRSVVDAAFTAEEDAGAAIRWLSDATARRPLQLVTMAGLPPFTETDVKRAFNKLKQKQAADEIEQVAIERIHLDHAIRAVCERHDIEPFHVYSELLGDQRIDREALGKGLAKRPWNTSLKRLCYLIGQSFNKFKNRDQCYYGHLLQQRWEKEQQRNDDGELAEQAGANLQRLKAKNTPTYKANIEGRLSDGHIFDRARRWVTKVFLTHYHAVAYAAHYQRVAPRPWVLVHAGPDQHVHEIKPPGFDDLIEKVIRGEY